jgi:hypothetical protein
LVAAKASMATREAHQEFIRLEQEKARAEVGGGETAAESIDRFA